MAVCILLINSWYLISLSCCLSTSKSYYLINLCHAAGEVVLGPGLSCHSCCERGLCVLIVLVLEDDKVGKLFPHKTIVFHDQ